VRVPGRAPNPDNGRNPRALARGRLREIRALIASGPLSREHRAMLAQLARSLDSDRYEPDVRGAARALLDAVE